MAFISSSVGALGGNQAADVRVIQWLLNQANIGYGFTWIGAAQIEGNSTRLPRAQNASPIKIPVNPGIQINGVMDGATQRAINDFAYWCSRGKFVPEGPARAGASSATILPDDDLYKRLIWAAVHAFAPKFIATDKDYDDPRIKRKNIFRPISIHFRTKPLAGFNPARKTNAKLSQQCESICLFGFDNQC